jgi:hypothetical protein
MTKRDRPFATYDTVTPEGRCGRVLKVFPTYRELKKNLHSMLLESDAFQISVTRFKRGEWGEWFEIWKLVNKKPVIIKQGWM